MYGTPASTAGVFLPGMMPFFTALIGIIVPASDLTWVVSWASWPPRCGADLGLVDHHQPDVAAVYGKRPLSASAGEIGLQVLTQGVLSGLVSTLLSGWAVRILAVTRAAAYRR